MAGLTKKSPGGDPHIGVSSVLVDGSGMPLMIVKICVGNRDWSSVPLSMGYDKLTQFQVDFYILYC